MSNSGQEVVSAFLNRENGGNASVWTDGEHLWANGEVIASWLNDDVVLVHGVPLVRRDLLKKQGQLFKECQAAYKQGTEIKKHERG